MLKKLFGYLEIVLITLTAVLVINAANEYLQGPWSTKRLLKNTVGMVKYPTGGGGTGFVVKLDTDKQVFITNAHVCDDNKEIHVLFAGKAATVPLKVTKTDPRVDLCQAEGVEVTNHPFALTIGKEMPHKYERIAFAGHPYLKPLAFIEGYVIDLEIVKMLTMRFPGEKCPKGATEVEVPAFFGVMVPACEMELREIMLQGAVYPGNSGSPVINSNKELVGIINISDGRTNNGGMIPLDLFKVFVTDTLKEPGWF